MDNSLLLLFIIIVVLGLDEIPLLLVLDGDLQRSVVVPLSVVADACVPPEKVQAQGTGNSVGVVGLVVVAHPSSDQSPGGFPGGVGAYSRDLLGSSA